MSFNYILVIFLAISFLFAFAAMGSILYIQRKQHIPTERISGDRRATDRRQGERRSVGRDANDRRSNDRRMVDRRVKTGSLLDRRLILNMFPQALSEGN